MSDLIIVRIEVENDPTRFATVEIREQNVGADEWRCTTADALLRDDGKVNEKPAGCVLADSGGTIRVALLEGLQLDPDPVAGDSGTVEVDAVPDESALQGNLRWRIIAVDP